MTTRQAVSDYPASPSAEAAFFALSESRELGAAICREAGLKPAPLEERTFEGGEFKLRPLVSVRGRTTFVCQCLAAADGVSVAERLVRLLFLINGLRDAGAGPRIAVIPYLAYARKERRTQLRDPVNSRYVAQLLEAAGVDRVIALDVHNPAALDNAFRVPVDHLTALPMLASHFAARLPQARLMVASPDVGGIKRAQLFQELLQAKLGRDVDLAFIEKRRARGVVSTGGLVGDPSGSHVVILDDLCATGGTLIRAAALCKEAGATALHVAVTHAPLQAGLAALAAADSITDVVVTDSAGDPHLPPSFAGGRLIRLSVAPLFGEAIRRMLCGRPVAPLLRHWPPPADE